MLVHNGKEFRALEMIGHYIGELAITNKPVKHDLPSIAPHAHPLCSVKIEKYGCAG